MRARAAARCAGDQNLVRSFIFFLPGLCSGAACRRWRGRGVARAAEQVFVDVGDAVFVGVAGMHVVEDDALEHGVEDVRLREQHGFCVATAIQRLRERSDKVALIGRRALRVISEWAVDFIQTPRCLRESFTLAPSCRRGGKVIFVFHSQY